MSAPPWEGLRLRVAGTRYTAAGSPAGAGTVIKMDEAHKRAQATREKNLEARAAMYREQAAAMRAARLALQRVIEREDATAAELLEAARLLAEIGRI